MKIICYLQEDQSEFSSQSMPNGCRAMFSILGDDDDEKFPIRCVSCDQYEVKEWLAECDTCKEQRKDRVRLHHVRAWSLHEALDGMLPFTVCLTIDLFLVSID